MGSKSQKPAVWFFQFMKWALTSPDGIGDFLLRLPWLFEMEREGWNLLLVARKPTLDLASLAGLAGDRFELSSSPYSKHVKLKRNPFGDVISSVANHQTKMLFFGPSQPSFLEEQMADGTRETPLGGFVVEEDFWPGECLAEPKEIARKLTLRVVVQHGDAEPERNAKAAESLLGRKCELAPFIFSEEAIKSFQARRSFPLPDSKYLVLSPGYRSGDYFTGLGVTRWIQELKLLEEATDWKFVFTGSGNEVDSNAKIFAGLSPNRGHQDLTGEIVNLEDLLALLAESQGYVGKDSGTLHLAASLQLPVLAVFGGGHWARFLPVGTRACVLTVKVPCRGCDWRCHHNEPYCVTALPVGCIVEGWRTLQELPNQERVCLEFSPGEPASSELQNNPGFGFPAKQHDARRKRLIEARARALNPHRGLSEMLFARFRQ
jgi:hypothetical protein